MKTVEAKKASRCDWFNGFLLDSTVEMTNGAKKSSAEVKNKNKKLTMQDEEYLCIGEEFY